MIARLAILVLSLTMAAATFAQSVATLKPVARLPVGEPITLADIAALTGDATTLADMVVIADPTKQSGPDRRLTIELEQVRDLIAGAADIHTGRISIRGDSCRVILRAQTPETKQESAQSQEPQPTAQIGFTVRDHVRAKLVQTLGVTPDHIKFTFDEVDEVLLSTATKGWTVDVQPMGSSAKMPLRITMYDKHGGIRDESIRVGVRILREIVRTTRAVRRGTTLTPDDFEVDQAWLVPDVQFIEPIAATGVRLKRSMGAGEMVTSGQAELAEVVRKGDIVSIHMISGTIKIISTARALESGRIGDQIEFTSKQGEGRFAAKIQEPGRAVVIQGGSDFEGLVR